MATMRRPAICYLSLAVLVLASYLQSGDADECTRSWPAYVPTTVTLEGVSNIVMPRTNDDMCNLFSISISGNPAQFISVCSTPRQVSAIASNGISGAIDYTDTQGANADLKNTAVTHTDRPATAAACGDEWRTLCNSQADFWKECSVSGTEGTHAQTINTILGWCDTYIVDSVSPSNHYVAVSVYDQNPILFPSANPSFVRCQLVGIGASPSIDVPGLGAFVINTAASAELESLLNTAFIHDPSGQWGGPPGGVVDGKAPSASFYTSEVARSVNLDNSHLPYSCDPCSLPLSGSSVHYVSSIFDAIVNGVVSSLFRMEANLRDTNVQPVQNRIYLMPLLQAVTALQFGSRGTSMGNQVAMRLRICEEWLPAGDIPTDVWRPFISRCISVLESWDAVPSCGIGPGTGLSQMCSMDDAIRRVSALEPINAVANILQRDYTIASAPNIGCKARIEATRAYTGSLVFMRAFYTGFATQSQVRGPPGEWVYTPQPLLEEPFRVEFPHLIDCDANTPNIRNPFGVRTVNVDTSCPETVLVGSCVAPQTDYCGFGRGVPGRWTSWKLAFNKPDTLLSHIGGSTDGDSVTISASGAAYSVTRPDSIDDSVRFTINTPSPSSMPSVQPEAIPQAARDLFIVDGIDANVMVVDSGDQPMAETSYHSTASYTYSPSATPAHSVPAKVDRRIAAAPPLITVLDLFSDIVCPTSVLSAEVLSNVGAELNALVKVSLAVPPDSGVRIVFAPPGGDIPKGIELSNTAANMNVMSGTFPINPGDLTNCEAGVACRYILQPPFQQSTAGVTSACVNPLAILLDVTVAVGDKGNTETDSDHEIDVPYCIFGICEPYHWWGFGLAGLSSIFILAIIVLVVYCLCCRTGGGCTIDVRKTQRFSV